MASPITWRNVNAPNLSGALSAANEAAEGFTRNLQQAGALSKQYGKEQLDANTNKLLAEAQAINSLDTYDQDAAELLSRAAEYGEGNINFNKVQAAVQGRDDTLRSEANDLYQYNEQQRQQAELPVIDDLTKRINSGQLTGQAALDAINSSGVQDTTGLIDTLHKHQQYQRGEKAYQRGENERIAKANAYSARNDLLTADVNGDKAQFTNLVNQATQGMEPGAKQEYVDSINKDWDNYRQIENPAHKSAITAANNQMVQYQDVLDEKYNKDIEILQNKYKQRDTGFAAPLDNDVLQKTFEKVNKSSELDEWFAPSAEEAYGIINSKLGFPPNASLFSHILNTGLSKESWSAGDETDIAQAAEEWLSTSKDMDGTQKKNIREFIKEKSKLDTRKSKLLTDAQSQISKYISDAKEYARDTRAGRSPKDIGRLNIDMQAAITGKTATERLREKAAAEEAERARLDALNNQPDDLPVISNPRSVTEQRDALPADAAWLGNINQHRF